MKCKDCNAEFVRKTVRQTRCKDCQEKYNNYRRNKLTKEANREKKGIEIKKIPKGYIYLPEWAEKQGHSLSGTQKHVAKHATQLGAIKVTNPSGGVDVWAIPENAQWL